MTAATPELEFRAEKFMPSFLVYVLELDLRGVLQPASR
jgi:hypothetical protein